MLIIGLTGSIGMGKSTLAGHLRARGIRVLDADAEVHKLYAGAAVPRIEAAFPGTTADGKVDRMRLSAALAKDPSSFKRLEAIVHPLVRDAERDFLHQAHKRGASLAVLEIPLLFETGGDRFVDITILASAPAAIQRERVLKRLDMTPEKLDLLLSRQSRDTDKRAKASFVVDTSLSLPATFASLDTIIDGLAGRDGTAFARHWA